MKVLGINLQQNLSFESHVTALLKQCSQRIYLLRMLRSQGLPADNMNTVFVALVISQILYALPAWGVFYRLVSVAKSTRFLSVYSNMVLLTVLLLLMSY